jgi:hypothetical protein
VSAPMRAIAPILARAGLPFTDNVLAWREVEHHMIGGNIGPRAQIANVLPKDPTLRWKYARRGLFLDNTYASPMQRFSRHPTSPGSRPTPSRRPS